MRNLESEPISNKEKGLLLFTAITFAGSVYLMGRLVSEDEKARQECIQAGQIDNRGTKLENFDPSSVCVKFTSDYIIEQYKRRVYNISW